MISCLVAIQTQYRLFHDCLSRSTVKPHNAAKKLLKQVEVFSEATTKREEIITLTCSRSLQDDSRTELGIRRPGAWSRISCLDTSYSDLLCSESTSGMGPRALLPPCHLAQRGTSAKLFVLLASKWEEGQPTYHLEYL